MTKEEQSLTEKMGLRLREARKVQGINRHELSIRAGGIFSQTRIRKFEEGKHRFSIEEARRHAQALGSVSTTYLLCLDDESFLSDQELALVQRFREANEQGRERILELATSTDSKEV